jgi:purine-cytosine permease-like protein
MRGIAMSVGDSTDTVDSGLMIATEKDEAFSVETRGIDLIPDSERHGRPRELFFIWAGANWVITGFIMGALLGSLGLPVWASILAMLFAQAGFALVGWVGGAGPRAGTATMLVSRASFGIRGNWPLAVFAWLTAVGWETVNAVVGVFALLTLFDVIGLGAGTAQTVLAIMILLGIVTLVAIWGHATILAVQRVLTWALAIGTIIAIGFGVPYMDWGHSGGAVLAADSPFSTWVLGLGIMMAGGAISYVSIGADFSRYLPKQSSIGSITVWTAIGSLFPSVFTITFGILIAGSFDMSVDPVAGFQEFLPTWYLVPFLVVVVGGLMANNTVNLYSSGLALQTVGIKVKRWIAVLIDSILVVIATSLALFAFDFIDFFVQFLSLLVLWTAPWCGVFLVDFALRRWQYKDPEDLFVRNGGRYWYTGGINWRAVIAWALGAVGAFMTTNAPLWVSPWSIDYLGGSDISWLVGLVVGGGVYWALEALRGRSSSAV